jgi:large subunit ribosomal protein L23
MSNDLSWVIKSVRLTEKAARLGSLNTYTFVIHPDSNKHQVADAIKAKYNVTPEKVTTTTRATRQGKKRGKPATIRGEKKAYVTLPQGKTIDFV